MAGIAINSRCGVNNAAAGNAYRRQLMAEKHRRMGGDNRARHRRMARRRVASVGLAFAAYRGSLKACVAANSCGSKPASISNLAARPGARRRRAYIVAMSAARCICYLICGAGLAPLGRGHPSSWRIIKRYRDGENKRSVGIFHLLQRRRRNNVPLAVIDAIGRR